MPERPDLEYVVPILARELAGRTVKAVRVKKPVVLRVAVPGKFEELVPGKRFGAVARRAHFVLFALPPYEMAIAPMLAGRFALAEIGGKGVGDLAVAFELDDGRELRYRDDVQMGKVYLIEKGHWDAVPGLAKIGIDVLSPAFTREAFRALARKRRDQAKIFLMDKAALDAMGNAYADEILFAARVHPKTFVKTLSDKELDALHDAIVEVLGEARATIAARKPALDEKLRDFLKVRGRHGEACPRCGTTIRAAGVHGHDADFCPSCQPATRKSGIVDWRKA
ncbi:MAG TPA: DNA-formamidopyrimidine glycosylase family protein [Haliangiales bacterium]|nr:DNA-formamidopyrimidine glycosylase family protein [Haliangiales bacterium]